MPEPLSHRKQGGALEQNHPLTPRADRAPGDHARPELVETDRVDPLLEAARRGDPAAFQALIAPHVESMRRLILSIVKKPEDADDVLQEALITVHRNMANIHNVRGYCMTTARSRALDKIKARRTKRERSTTRFDDMNPDPDGPRWEATADAYAEMGQTPERAAEMSEERERIMEILEQLPEDQRQLIIMADAQGMTLLEIAQTLGVSQSTVYRKLSRARYALQAILKAA